MHWKFLEQLKNGPWLNTEEYSITVLIVFLIGCLLWVGVYAVMFTKGIKYKTIEYPFIGMASAFAWEFWFGCGIIKVTDMGAVLQISYFLWFFGDCFLFYLMWKYGKDQMITPNAIKNFHIKFIMMLVIWFAIWPPFGIQLDDPVGAFSGWVCNLLISTCFVYEKIKKPDWGTSRWIAVLKFLGTGVFCSVVIYTHLMDNWVLIVLWGLQSAMDIIYIVLVFRGPTNAEVLAKKKEVPAAIAA